MRGREGEKLRDVEEKRERERGIEELRSWIEITWLAALAAYIKDYDRVSVTELTNL